VITALGPKNWQPRTSLGWKADHYLGYFVMVPSREWLEFRVA
jgi:hypothetical protein